MLLRLGEIPKIVQAAFSDRDGFGTVGELPEGIDALRGELLRVVRVNAGSRETCVTRLRQPERSSAFCDARTRNYHSADACSCRALHDCRPVAIEAVMTEISANID